MRRFSENRIFARTDPADFIGRETTLEHVLARAKNVNEPGGLVILSTPRVGATELLRQTFDRLFLEQAEVIPFYFEIKLRDGSAYNAACRFLHEFLLQTVAFRRRDARIIRSAPELAEIAELAVPSDVQWIDRLIEGYSDRAKNSDVHSFVRNCLSAPIRAAANGVPVAVLIDDLHTAGQLDGGETFLDDICDIFSQTSIPFIASGHRRFLFNRTPFETLPLDSFSFADSGKFVEQLSAKTGVAVNDQTRDLVSVQLSGNAGHISSLVAAAAASGQSLDTFEHVEQVYTDEIFGGRIGSYYDASLARIFPDSDLESRVIRLLGENISTRAAKIPLAYWKRHANAGDCLETALDDLNNIEIVSVSSGFVETDSDNIIFGDYLRGRIRLQLEGESRAKIVGEALAENIRRAPLLMSRFYRRTSAIGLRNLLNAFDGRQVSAALLDYGRFSKEFKGAPDDKIERSLKEDNAKIALPNIVYTALTSAFYPQLDKLCDAERSAVALGFSGNDETAWVAIEIDSKLEVKRDIAEFWCDRLEMVALNCNLPLCKFWLISPEGFDPEAIEVLRDRNAHGSSKKQVSLLASTIKASVETNDAEFGDEYEIVVPMGEDTEMIAAHTVEDIARRHNFPAKAINQIKTALVEACINATEHSMSPDRRIYQKFLVAPDKITITVSNRGVRLLDKGAVEVNPTDGRRGWGLKLMRGLMDDVKIENTDDGTRITMVKLISVT